MELEKLLYLQGVGAEFIDCFGNHIHIPAADREGILKTMCLDGSNAPWSEPWVVARIDELDAKPWQLAMASFQWCFIDELSISVYLPDGFVEPLTFMLTTESGDTCEFVVTISQMIRRGDYRIGQQVYGHYQYHLDHQCQVNGKGALPELGYHQLTLRLGQQQTLAHSRWMVAPRIAYQGRLTRETSAPGLDGQAEAIQRSRAWGVSVHLYALRSERQWGIGDFGDLAGLIDYIASFGADFILLNPLHALDIADPLMVSPYSPCDRRRLNPLYIQIETLPEYACIRERFTSDEWHSEIAGLAQEHWLNYPAVYQLKYRALLELYQVFCRKHLNKDTHRNLIFHEFVAREGAALQEFACAEAARAPATLTQDVNFYCYLQFVASEQLELCQLRAKQSGMSIGLIRDLAVGAQVHGVEVQANQSQFCLHASIGAPPDPFAPQGQNWGLTPLDPIKLKQHDFTHFIALVRSNMRFCGALRIDHVMALLRLWWWPLNAELGKGAYVYYPLETLLAILCLESQRQRCILIGEDLGIVPPEIVSRLYQAGIYSNELFYFCKDHDGFKSPQDYKYQSLMMLANHDVPTLKAWWSASDLHLRRQLDLIASDEALNAALDSRGQEKLQLLVRLVAEGFLHDSDCRLDLDISQLLVPWLAMAASGNAALFSVQLSDLLADRHSVNIPGTWQEYPNWQRRLPLTLTQLIDDADVTERLLALGRARRGPWPDRLSRRTANMSSNSSI